jgi:predicted secreted protein
MFADHRSKKIVLVAHCLLNQNSISDGTADFPSQFKEVVDVLMTSGAGIIQLPCPELLCLGLDRQDKNGVERELLEENSRIRDLMQQKANLNRLREKAGEIVAQLQEYRHYGFTIVGLVGVNRSPSCGVSTTSIACEEKSGMGVFMQLLSEELNKQHLKVEMV